MAAALFALATLALALWAPRARTLATPGGLALALGVGGAAGVALGVFERVGAGVPPTAQAPFFLLAALAALALWGALAVLAFHQVRRRDAFWIAPFGLLALLDLGMPTSEVGLALVLALPVVARWRWLDRLGRRALGATFFLGLVLAAAAFLPLTPRAGGLSALAETLERRIAWARMLAALYLILALPGVLRRWSLGIRRVSRRLALLLALSSAVPLILVAILWITSTVLGVGGERALIGARLLEQRALELQTSLAALPDSGGAGALAALVRAHPGWPGLRIWQGASRVHGAPIPDEAGLGVWPDTLAQRGLVVIGRKAWIGARARGPRAGFVALAPVEEVLRAEADSLLGARFSFRAGDAGAAADSFGRAVEDLAAGAPGAEDSLEARLARTQRDRGAGIVRIQIRENEPVLSSSDFRFGAGHAVIEGVRWRGGRWRRTAGLLNVDVPWAETLAGLASNARENPYNILPLALIALVLVFVLMLAAADFGMVRTLGRSITAAVAALRQGAARLEGGELSHRIRVEGEDDLWDVAAAFNRMAVGLERGRQLEIDRQRIEDELALARRIQARLLPPGPPQIQGLELAGISEPAREVGGDYYDFVPLQDGRVALVVADVSGKGVGAALLMSGFRASLLSQDLASEEQARVLERLNAFLHRSVEPGKFVTAFLGVLCGRTGRLRYCNAGHNPPIVSRKNGGRERLETGGLILGIVEHAPYETGETTLEAGDRLTLFTDGVTEAVDDRNQQWGEEPLFDLLEEMAERSCAETISRIVAEVRRFEGGRGASDDVTLLMARRTG